MNFNTKEAFTDHLNNLPEKGSAYPDIVYDELYDVSPGELIKLNRCKISFEEYDQFLVFVHPDTNEVFLGDMNDGGHAVRCRLIKIHREDLFTKQASMNQWYENRAWKMWER